MYVFCAFKMKYFNIWNTENITKTTIIYFRKRLKIFFAQLITMNYNLQQNKKMKTYFHIFNIMSKDVKNPMTLQVNKMSLEEVEGSSNSFIIHALGSNKPKQSFLCRAPEPRCQHWITTLSTILQSQLIFGERLENPSAFLNRDAAA